ncbi:hypothetical protein AGMMS49587_12120 [Spirochaetia bacterium]|nr:hypothetical protein AGMMS49587_12120 [Spirochaetia bacterium]
MQFNAPGVRCYTTSHVLSGADTAIILTPGHAGGFFETRVHEILCKPNLA